MRFSNDCTIASISMVTGLPHYHVLKAAISCGFKPDGKYGISVHQVLYALEWGCCLRIYSGYKWRPMPRRLLPFQQPIIVSVDSVNNLHGRHAIVVYNGKVYDPSRKKQVSFERMMLTRQHIYYGFYEIPK